jgi:hypothetical protein
MRFYQSHLQLIYLIFPAILKTVTGYMNARARVCEEVPK